MCACYQSPWASVHLLQSCSRYRAQPRQSPAAAAPEAGYDQLQGPYRGPYCLYQHTLSWKPRALSELIVSELTSSLQKRLNACSLIIWILVNWINCWIETVLLKMTKTQGQGEQKGGLISFPLTPGLSDDTNMHTHTHIEALPVSLSSSDFACCFTNTSCMWPNSEEGALGKVQITMRTVRDKN